MQTSVGRHFFWYEYFPLFSFLSRDILYLSDLLAKIAFSLSHDFRYTLSNTYFCTGDFLLLLSFTTVFAGTFPWRAAAFLVQDSAADVGITSSAARLSNAAVCGEEEWKDTTPPMPVCQYLQQVPLGVHEEADPLPRSEGGLAEEEESTHVQGGCTLTGVQGDQLQHCCPLHPPEPFTTVPLMHFTHNILAKEMRGFSA